MTASLTSTSLPIISPFHFFCSSFSPSLLCCGLRSHMLLCSVLTVIESDLRPRRLCGIPYMVRLWPADLQLRSDSIGWKAPCAAQQSAASQNQGVRGRDSWKWVNEVRSATYRKATVPSFWTQSGAREKRESEKWNLTETEFITVFFFSSVRNWSDKSAFFLKFKGLSLKTRCWFFSNLNNTVFS